MRTSALAPALAITLALCANAAAYGPATRATVAESPIPAQHLTTLGDSITWGQGASDRTKTSYAALLAKSLRAVWTNLGIKGETLIPQPNSFFTGISSKGYAYAPTGGILKDEVPSIPLDTTVVTVYIGTNDQWMTRASIKPDFSNEATITADVAAAWQSGIAALVTGIRARVPLAHIVIASVYNDADKGSIVSLNAEPYATYRSKITAMVNAMNNAISAQGVTIADLHCDSRIYDVKNYVTQYDLHPNDAGHYAIFTDFYNAIERGGGMHACVYDSVIAPH